MPYTDDEMVIIRKAAGTNPDDPSKDADLVTPRTFTGPAYVPEDPQFYLDLKAASERFGFDPKSALIVIASESNFKTGFHGDKPAISASGPYAGHDTRPRGLIGFTYPFAGSDPVKSVYSLEEWDAMPSMTQTQQLEIVSRFFDRVKVMTAGKPLRSIYDLYLAAAAPSLITWSGKYDMKSPLYQGDNWASNLGLDAGPPFKPNGVPVGDTFLSYAYKRGDLPKLKTQADKLAYAKDLVQKGIIKGFVSMGDLLRHVDRMNDSGWKVAWQLANYRYKNAVANALGTVIPASLVSPELDSFPDTEPDSSVPLESDASMGKPSEPLRTTPLAEDTLLPEWLKVGAMVAVIGTLTYFWTQKK